MIMIFDVPPLWDTVCVWVILVTTVVSGVEYFVKNRDVLDMKK